MAATNDPLPFAGVTLEAYLCAAPSDEETARRAVAPYRGMSPAERWVAFADLLREVEGLLGDTPPHRPGPLFWHHWRDPDLGRPR